MTHSDALFPLAEALVAEARTDGASISNGKLRKFLKSEIAYRWTQILHEIDNVYKKRDSDKLANPDRIRDAVVAGLSDRCLNEAQELVQKGGSDESLKRHLKILAVFVSYPKLGESRRKILQNLERGSVGEFPYVLRYLAKGTTPKFTNLFTPKRTIVYDWCTKELETVLPEARYLKDAIERYESGSGSLASSEVVEAPVSEENAEAFGKLPAKMQTRGGIIDVPREIVLTHHRRIEYAHLDGVVCLVGLTVLVEWLVRQCCEALAINAGANDRVEKLVHRLKDARQITQASVGLFEQIFNSRVLDVRNTLAHGLFFADDHQLVSAGLGLITTLLSSFMTDLQVSGTYQSVLASPRWDVANQLVQQHVVTLRTQHSKANLAKFAKDDASRETMFDTIRGLIPNKAMLCRAAFLWWIRAESDKRKNGTINPSEQILAVLATLICLEDVFRAVLEVHGRNTLILRPNPPSGISCELAILHTDPGMLLSSDNMDALFDAGAGRAELDGSVHALKTCRDQIMHGNFNIMAGVELETIHLFVKFLFALAGGVKAQVTPSK